MLKTTIYNALSLPTELEKSEIVNFLFKHLEEYGDAKEDIMKALNYAMKDYTSFGGLVITLHDDTGIKGACIINKTGMGGYIPENILVYIATHNECRGQGLGSKLLKIVIDHTDGDIALHVEPSNPAQKLYEKFGFKAPYLEMRLKK